MTTNEPPQGPYGDFTPPEIPQPAPAPQPAPIPPADGIPTPNEPMRPSDLIEQAHKVLPKSQLIMREGFHFDIYEPPNYQEVGDAMAKFYLSSFSN